jgi:hypothetical protein
MGKKTLKAAALAALLGTVLSSGGCWGQGWWGRLLGDSVLYVAEEFLLDNNGVVDLFTDN